MISAVDLLKGIAVGTGMDIAHVEGANGGLNTNYEGKMEAAFSALTEKGYDFAYIHLEGPDEMGHQGSLEKKIKAIEYLDQRIVGPLYEKLTEKQEAFRMLILPDHPTPIKIKTHTSDPVPFLIYRSNDEKDSGLDSYNETTAASTGLYIEKGYTLMQKFLNR